MTASIEVTIDAVDDVGAVAFWRAALGYGILYEREPFVVLGPPPGDPRPRLLVQRVTAVDPGKPRVHLDLRADDPAMEVARLEELGATILRKIDETTEGGTRWTVMSDPQGAIFCVCPAREE